MSTAFKVLQAMSGQGEALVIPGVYADYFSDDLQHIALGAVLNQLVFWSGVASSAEDGWFYKEHAELGAELRMKGSKKQVESRVSRLIEKLSKTYFPDIIETKTQKVNGTPKKHYRIDGEALLAKLFPSKSETSKVKNGNLENEESKPQNRGMESTKSGIHRNLENEDSFLYTDLNSDHNLQINKTSLSQNSNESSDKAEDDVSDKNLNSAVSSANGQLWGSIEDLEIAQWMFKRVQIINPKQKTPKWFDWANDVRLMRQIDGRTHEQICALFDWANKDSFWFKVILSPRNLRKHFDELTVKSIDNPHSKKSQVSHSSECDKAFKRFLGQSLPIENPTDLEIMVRRDASNVGVKRMQPEYAQKKWVSIWKECEQRLGGAA